MTPGTRVALNSERLEIHDPDTDEMLETHPLAEIEHLVVHSGVRLGTQAISRILKTGISIVFASAHRVVRGVATPTQGGVLRKAVQIDACRHPPHRIRFARVLVEAKIRNQLRVLARLASYRGQRSAVGSSLRSLARKACSSHDLDHLRGLEGAAAAAYYKELADYFPEEIPFEKRSTQPPKNPANAILSYLYVTIASEMHMHVLARGLESGWGFFHEPEDRKHALALDLVEPYRAPLADALALDLLNHHRLRLEHFEQSGGGWYLRNEACRLVLEALEERLVTEFHHNQTDSRLTLRQTMKNQVLSTLAFIEERSPFKPFHMN